MPQRCAALLAAAAIGSAGLVACGTSSKTGSPTSGRAAHPASARGSDLVSQEIVLPLGLAFGTFHHLIYAPFRAGLLRPSRTHNLALARAASAAGFAYEELRAAAPRAGRSRFLQALFAPITLIATKMLLLRSQLPTGTFAQADIDAVEADIVQVSAASKASGQPIHERYVAK